MTKMLIFFNDKSNLIVFIDLTETTSESWDNSNIMAYLPID